MAKHAGDSRWGLWREAHAFAGVKPCANKLKKLLTNRVKSHYPWMEELSS